MLAATARGNWHFCPTLKVKQLAGSKIKSEILDHAVQNRCRHPSNVTNGQWGGDAVRGEEQGGAGLTFAYSTCCHTSLNEDFQRVVLYLFLSKRPCHFGVIAEVFGLALTDDLKGSMSAPSTSNAWETQMIPSSKEVEEALIKRLWGRKSRYQCSERW